MDNVSLDLGLTEDVFTPAVAPAQKSHKGKVETTEPKYHKGKAEYASPFYTINIAFVEGMPEFEVIQVNGEAIQILRGEDVPNIPHAFVQVLKTAIASRQVTKHDRDGRQYYEWQPYPAIPYQIIAGPYATRKIPEVAE